jgi:hypothetical protein
MITRREIAKKQKLEKYRQMYRDMTEGLTYREIALKYGYKNAHTVRVVFYKYVNKRLF